MPVPRKEHETSSRERVVSIARQHFLQRGFRGVSMDELAGALGMSKRTLYELFPAKKALIEAVIQQKFSQIETELEAISVAKSADFLYSAKEVLACIHRHTSEVQPAFVHDIQRQAPEIFSLIEKKRRALIERHFERLIKRGQASGNIRADVPSRFFVEMLLAGVSAIVTPAKMEELGMTPRNGLMTVFSVVFEGLLTDKGRKML